MSHSRYLRRSLAAIYAVSMAAVLVPVAAQAQSYSLTLLGGANSAVYAVNDSGQATGDFITSAGYDHAFLSGINGGPLQDLGTLPTGPGSIGVSVSSGYGVNSSGQVTGFSITADGYLHAFFFDANSGPMKDLGSLEGTDSYSYGTGINSSGQVVGYSFLPGGPNHAFLSGANGGSLSDLGTLPGGTQSAATAVNDNGQVTGYSTTAAGAYHAFLSGPGGGVLTDLGTLGGSTSIGYAINALGEVTGSSATASGASHAFVFGINGVGLTDLGTLGGTSSSARGVNAAGQVVGDSTTAAGADHAFLFTSGSLIDLNSLIDPGSGFTLTGANEISDTGYITGYGVSSTGQKEAFLLTPNFSPVPEAATTVSLGLLLTLGLGSLIVSARRKQTVPA